MLFIEPSPIVFGASVGRVGLNCMFKGTGKTFWGLSPAQLSNCRCPLDCLPASHLLGYFCSQKPCLFPTPPCARATTPLPSNFPPYSRSSVSGLVYLLYLDYSESLPLLIVIVQGRLFGSVFLSPGILSPIFSARTLPDVFPPPHFFFCMQVGVVSIE